MGNNYCLGIYAEGSEKKKEFDTHRMEIAIGDLIDMRVQIQKKYGNNRLPLQGDGLEMYLRRNGIIATVSENRHPPYGGIISEDPHIHLFSIGEKRLVKLTKEVGFHNMTLKGVRELELINGSTFI